MIIKNTVTLSKSESCNLGPTVRNDLTLENPVYHKNLNLEIPNWNVKKYLQYFNYDDDKNLVIPVGYLPELLKKYPSLKNNITDLRFEGIELKNLKFKGKLRDYQENAVNSMVKRTIGIVQAATGSGKTVLAINYLCQLKKQTLILVDTIELANQWKSSLIKFTNLDEEDIGLYGNNKKEIKPVTIALLQSMHRMDRKTCKKMNEEFGVVVVDEIHIIAAQTYYAVINKLKAKYKFALTATPKREDGLTNVIFFANGPIIYKIDEDKLKSFLSIPEYKSVATNYYYPLMVTSDYTYMISDLSVDEERNDLIVSERNKYPDKQAVILCSRISQVILLHRKIPDSDFLISTLDKNKKSYLRSELGCSDDEVKEFSKKTTKKYREKVIENLNNKKLNTIISTYKLFNKGIDVKTLELLLFAGPVRSEVLVKQSRGRIMRKNKNKKSLIIDFIDEKVELLKVQSWFRKKVLTKK